MNNPDYRILQYYKAPLHETCLVAISPTASFFCTFAKLNGISNCHICSETDLLQVQVQMMQDAILCN